ncbi:MAG: hypothetical protein WC565_09590 [Parcubacteria group bacterium]|jgi:hypothetical protein
MAKSNLLKAYENAAAHKRTFNVAGVDLVFPRLNLKHQSLFEKSIRESDPESKFSLALTRNTAAMEMSRCVEDVIGDLRKKGLPDRFDTEADARLWEAQLQAGVLSRWQPYAQAIFSPFRRDKMAEAILYSLRQEYGETMSKGGKTPEEIPIDEDFVEVVFGDDQEALDRVFLWVVGLANIPEKGEAEATVQSATDLVKKYGGGEGNATTPTEESGGEKS